MKSVVLVVEDELLTAETITLLLKDEDYEVMGPVRSAHDALMLCAHSTLAPDIALCDIRLQGDTKGTELALQLKQRYACEIIFLTAFSDQKTVAEAFKVDPAMYLIKPFTEKQLLITLQLAFHRHYSKQPASTSTALVLTAKEQEILGLIARGLTTKQIARRLNISIETIKTHRKRMLKKNNTPSFPLLVFKFSSKIPE